MYILPEKIFSILTATIPAGGVLNTNCMMYTKGKDPQPNNRNIPNSSPRRWSLTKASELKAANTIRMRNTGIK
jgi:hypothetical protein